MSFDISELAANYQYPMMEIEGNKIVWANPSARFFFERILETDSVSDLLGINAAAELEQALQSGELWSGKVRLEGGEVSAELAFVERKAFIVVKPAEKVGGLPFDSVISDCGQMIKEPLLNLYAALQQIESCAPEDFRSYMGIARHNFYMLACLSENQIAQAPVNPLECRNNLQLMPVKETLDEIIAAANEALGDKAVSVEIDGAVQDRFCRIYKKKLIQLFLLLLSGAVRNSGDVNIGFRMDDSYAYIEVPVNRHMISLFDCSDYAALTGTHEGRTALEGRMLSRIINNFNSIHKSRIFTSASKNGSDSVVIAIQTEAPSALDVHEKPAHPELIFGGLRPDLIFLSDILGPESYN